MKRLAALTTLLLWCGLASPDGPPVVIPPKAATVTTTVPPQPVVATVGKILRLQLDKSVAAGPVLWEVSGGVEWIELSDNVIAIPVFHPGPFTVSAYVSVPNNKPAKVASITVTTEGPAPGPTPGPAPPPGPTPPPAPVRGLRVIFVVESSANHTREQLNILNSTAIASYLNAKAAKDEKGQPSWRRWDKDQVFAAGESAAMKALFDAAKPQLGTLPMLLIASDQKAELYPLPATEAETLELLKKYGGP